MEKGLNGVEKNHDRKQEFVGLWPCSLCYRDTGEPVANDISLPVVVPSYHRVAYHRFCCFGSMAEAFAPTSPVLSLGFVWW